MQSLDWVHGKDPFAYIKTKSKRLKDHFFGSAPAPFIGHYNYPNVNVGILSPGNFVSQAELYDSPRYWSNNNFQIPQIAALRQELINSRFKAYIKSSSKMLSLSQEVGIASRPAEVEVNLEKVPRSGIYMEDNASPTGPRASLAKARITSNTKIKTSVQKAVDDTDLKAVEAVEKLYKKGFEDSYLSRILSVGALGIGKNRRLVPTRWSITAVDDTLGRKLHKKIEYFNETDIKIYSGGHLGNYFTILFLPGPWSFELFELVVEQSKENLYYSTDYEYYNGRSDYAHETVGGYYATRLAVLERLNELKKNGSVLVLRFITKEYTMPLGVWVVREAVRKALSNNPLRFGDEFLALTYLKSFAKKKHGLIIDPILERDSRLLNNRRSQRHLSAYFKR